VFSQQNCPNIITSPCPYPGVEFLPAKRYQWTVSAPRLCRSPYLQWSLRRHPTEIEVERLNVARCIQPTVTVLQWWRRHSARISSPQQNSWIAKS